MDPTVAAVSSEVDVFSLKIEHKTAVGFFGWHSV